MVLRCYTFIKNTNYACATAYKGYLLLYVIIRPPPHSFTHPCFHTHPNSKSMHIIRESSIWHSVQMFMLWRSEWSQVFTKSRTAKSIISLHCYYASFSIVWFWFLLDFRFACGVINAFLIPFFFNSIFYEFGIVGGAIKAISQMNTVEKWFYSINSKHVYVMCCAVLYV